VRVIAGAAPHGFAVPVDEIGRRRALDLPEGFVWCRVRPRRRQDCRMPSPPWCRRVDLPVVVIDAPEGDEPGVLDLAAAAGLGEGHVHVRGALDDADRAAVFGGAVALLAPSRLSAFPWRAVEALAVGVPVVASDTDVHREVVLDGGVFAGADELGASLADVLASAAAVERFGVLAADRGRAFSWPALPSVCGSCTPTCRAL
jgi:hypothetical protein